VLRIHITARKGAARAELAVALLASGELPAEADEPTRPHGPTSRLWKSRCRASHTSVAFAKDSRSARCSSRQRVRVNCCNSATLIPDTVKRRWSTMAMSASAARPFSASTRRSGGSTFQNQRQRRRSYAASRHSAAIKRNSATRMVGSRESARNHRTGSSRGKSAVILVPMQPVILRHETRSDGGRGREYGPPRVRPIRAAGDYARRSKAQKAYQ